MNASILTAIQIIECICKLPFLIYTPAPFTDYCVNIVELVYCRYLFFLIKCEFNLTSDDVILTNNLIIKNIITSYDVKSNPHHTQK